MTTVYHVTAETPDYFVEADVEAEYKYDAEAEDPEDAYYPVRYAWFDITLTDKKTGKSEFADEMPDDLIGLMREEAACQFPL
jgi:hypothetical protein